VAIYLNFFADHHGWDLRWVLFGAAALIFGARPCGSGRIGAGAECRCCWPLG
jgi:hypothetical protein